MNVLRLVTVAAASTALVAAVAPSAQALSGSALDTTARATGMATRYAVPVAENAIGDKVGQKVGGLQHTLKAGTDAVAGVNELVN